MGGENPLTAVLSPYLPQDILPAYPLFYSAPVAERQLEMTENNSAEQTQQSAPQAKHSAPQSSNSQAQRKKHGKKWREIHPRSLFRAIAEPDGISDDRLRALVETEYINPVITL